jgi:hypothetical protein
MQKFQAPQGLGMICWFTLPHRSHTDNIDNTLSHRFCFCNIILDLQQLCDIRLNFILSTIFYRQQKQHLPYLSFSFTHQILKTPKLLTATKVAETASKLTRSFCLQICWCPYASNPAIPNIKILYIVPAMYFVIT